MDVSYFKTPKGDEMAILSRQDFESLLVQADEAITIKEAQGTLDRVQGGEETYPHELIVRLGQENPILVWRQYRGKTQVQLCQQVGIKQGYLSELEQGRKQGSIDVLKKLAKALYLDVGDLID